MRQPWKFVTLVALVCGAFLAVTGAATSASANLTGAIYTTDALCIGNNVNHFPSKDLVYLDGGPQQGGSGLPDGEYYIQITAAQQGTLLGTSIGSGDDTPIVVVNGSFVQCYQLTAILIKASDGTPGYDTSSNGEYKVWISPASDFKESKTDNFQVDSDVPSAATFRSASAVRTGHAVVVRWKTASEVDTLGFNVYRLVNGKRVHANKHLILAHGGAYSFVDRKAPSARNLRYRIQAVHADGSSSWLGPLAVKRQS